MLRNYRKETALDLARQAGHLHLIPILERGPSKILPDRASTAANRDRDIKQVRKQEQPTDSLGPVTKQELIANVAKYKSVLPNQGGSSGPGPAEIERMMEERQQEALAKKEEAIRARKEQERLAKIEEERIYVASLAGAGQDEKKRAAALLAREEIRKKHEEKMREWERQRAAEEEEGRRALEELARKRELAAKVAKRLEAQSRCSSVFSGINGGRSRSRSSQGGVRAQGARSRRQGTGRQEEAGCKRNGRRGGGTVATRQRAQVQIRCRTQGGRF